MLELDGNWVCGARERELFEAVLSDVRYLTQSQEALVPLLGEIAGSRGCADLALAAYSATLQDLAALLREIAECRASEGQ